MIESILIQNFQAHKRLEVLFSPTITTIIGESNRGKSSIIRALYWLCFNRPSGISFIRHGATSAKVTLKIDGHKITRKRSSKGNFYFVDGKKLKCVGSQVPEEVTAILKLEDMNFQHQLDPPFWFSLTPGQVSKELNQIINLGSIDNALANISTKVKEKKRDVSYTFERLDAARQAASDMKWVKELDNKLKQIETNQKEIVKLESEIATLANLVVQYTAKKIEANVEIPDLSSTDDRIESLKKLKDSADSLEGLLNTYKQLEQESCRHTALIKETEAEIHKMEKGNCPVCGKPLT